MPQSNSLSIQLLKLKEPLFSESTWVFISGYLYKEENYVYKKDAFSSTSFSGASQSIGAVSQNYTIWVKFFEFCFDIFFTVSLAILTCVFRLTLLTMSGFQPVRLCLPVARPRWWLCQWSASSPFHIERQGVQIAGCWQMTLSHTVPGMSRSAGDLLLSCISFIRRSLMLFLSSSTRLLCLR